MGRKRRRGKKHSSRPPKIFIEGTDTYKVEYEHLLMAPPVNGEVVVCELDEKTFEQTSSRQKLAAAGFSEYSVVQYDTEYDNEPKSKVVGRACAVPAQVKGGKVRPFVFVDSDIRGESKNEDVAWAIRTLMLLHEFGHADDILKGKNFDHASRTLDIVEAEIYAHLFAAKVAQKRGYREGLSYYISNFQEYAKSDSELLKEVAAGLLSCKEYRSMRQWVKKDPLQDPTSRFHREAARRARRGLL